MNDSRLEDERYQERVLPLVSRSFALTIPQLPAELRLMHACAAGREGRRCVEIDASLHT
jgi:hypothetical protein